MNKTQAWATGTAVVAVLAFMQAEIQVIHDDVQDVKEFLVKTNERINYTSADAECLAKNIWSETERFSPFSFAYDFIP